MNSDLPNKVESSSENAQFVERQTYTLKISELNTEILHPENVLIKFSDEVRIAPYDIGGLAFEVRLNSDKKNRRGNYLVEKQSLNQYRCEFLRRLFDDSFSVSSRQSTIKSKFDDIKQIVVWADENGHSDFLNSLDAARKMYQSFSSFLIQGLKRQTAKIGRQTSSTRQRALREVFSLQFGESLLSQITQGVTVIIGERNPTKPPREKEKNDYISVCLATAKRCREFILDKKSFPFLLKMPSYQTYVFPANGNNMVTPHSPRGNQIYNFEVGRISTPEEYIQKRGWELSSKCLRDATRAVVDAQQNLDIVNTEERHEHRIQIASLAIQAYTQLFIIITGAYPSELVDLEFDERYELDRDLFKNDFRAVKFRAKGRVVKYNLGDVCGYEIIKDYLSIRKWMLNGEECKYLFFKNSKGEGGGYKEQFKQLVPADVGRYYKRAKGVLFSGDVKNIPASKARKYRSVVLHELRQDPLVIAAWQNHKLSTSLKDYGETTDDRSSEEFSSFWKAVIDTRNRIKIKFVESANHQDADIPSGHCEDNGNPSSVVKNPLIEPNCNTQLGCLFCEHYCLHADEEDLRKLFSLLFVVQEIRKHSSNFGHAESLYKELTVKVKSLILSIKERSDGLEQLAEKVEYEVMKLGSINDFWNNKLARFERLGVVF